jgi:hypothetical protein
VVAEGVAVWEIHASFSRSLRLLLGFWAASGVMQPRIKQATKWGDTGLFMMLGEGTGKVKPGGAMIAKSLFHVIT